MILEIFKHCNLNEEKCLHKPPDRIPDCCPRPPQRIWQRTRWSASSGLARLPSWASGGFSWLEEVGPSFSAPISRPYPCRRASTTKSDFSLYFEQPNIFRLVDCDIELHLSFLAKFVQKERSRGKLRQNCEPWKHWRTCCRWRKRWKPDWRRQTRRRLRSATETGWPVWGYESNPACNKSFQAIFEFYALSFGFDGIQYIARVIVVFKFATFIKHIFKCVWIKLHFFLKIRKQKDKKRSCISTDSSKFLKQNHHTSRA